jgi:signal transduction histidine kinase
MPLSFSTTISSKRSQLVNRLLLTGAGAAVVHAGIDAMYASWAVVGADINIALWMLFLWGLNRQGYYVFVRYALLISLSLVLLAYGSVIPAENGINLLFLPMMSLAFVLFDYRQHGAKLAISMFMLGCFLLLEGTDYQLLGSLELQEEADRASFIVNFLTAGAMLYFSFSTVTHANHAAEERLQQKTEELEEQNELLSKTNEELDRFVYSTSHDLRAPLLSMLGLLQLLENKKADEPIQPYLNMLRNRVENLESFINDIRTYAHNNRRPVEAEPLLLCSLVSDIYSHLRYLQSTTPLTLRQDIAPQSPLLLDRERLTTILSNLVANAIKYHRPDQENPFVTVGARLEENQLHLWVQDNGPGIAPQIQARMFEMFYRGDERSGGSGLGLYLVKETLEKLGGSIMAESELGRGSTFHVWVPLNNSQNEKQAAPLSMRG